MVNRIQKKHELSNANLFVGACWIAASIAVGIATDNVWLGIATCAGLAAILGAIDIASEKISDTLKK